jgi:RNA polymerase sigma-70 factor, ECF subfamily
MDDDELITRLAGGDDTALRELFTQHAPMLAARLRTALPPSDVEDVLQETFLAAWKGAGSYRPQEKAGGWLWGIARRQAALLLRRRGPAAAALPDFPEPGAGSLPGSCFTADPAQLLTDASELASAVGALNPADREVWQLMYVEDRPVAEVARLTGVSYWATARGLDGVGGHNAATAAAAVTFAWLIPMTAVCTLTLAVAVITRSASAGALTGVIAWGVTVLANRVSAGAFTATVTDTATYLPYLAVAACATAVIGYATRIPRRTH